MNNNSEHNGAEQDQIEHIESLASADQPNYTIPVRFQALKVTSTKQPPFRAFLQPDGVLSGMAMPLSIFQSEEDKSFTVQMPGTRWQKGLIPMPAIVRTVKNGPDGEVFGELLDHDDPNADGLWKIKKLPEALMDAFNRYRATGIADQFVTLQPE